MSDPAREEDRRLAERLLELAEIIRKGHGTRVWVVLPLFWADDLVEAAAFINRFSSDD